MHHIARLGRLMLRAPSEDETSVLHAKDTIELSCSWQSSQSLFRKIRRQSSPREDEIEGKLWYCQLKSVKSNITFEFITLWGISDLCGIFVIMEYHVLLVLEDICYFYRSSSINGRRVVELSRTLILLTWT